MSIRLCHIVVVLIVLLMAAGKMTYAQDKPQPAPQETSFIKHPLADVPAMQLKMDYDPILTKYPILYIKINGSEPKPFIFDTGYSGTILINEGEAKKLGLEMTDSDTVNADINGVRDSLHKSIVKSLEMLTLDGSYVPGTDVSVNIGKVPTNDETSFPTPAIGLVGLGAFKGATLSCDFERHELRVIIGDQKDASALKDSLSAPLIYEERTLRVDMSDLVRKKELLILDTGAENTRLSKELIETFNPTLSLDTSSQGGSGAVRNDKSYLIDAILLKDIPINNLIITEARGNDSILGIDILSRFRLIIDIAHRKIILEQSGTFAEQNKRPPGYSGITLERRTGGNIVIAHTTSDQKNLAGYQLVGIDDKRIDGKTITDLPLAQVQSLLDGYAHTETTITIRSRGGDRAVIIRRRTLQEILPLLKEMK